MAVIIRMPSVMAGATEATIAQWMVAEGDVINVGDAMAEIETEKAVVEYAAEEAGTLGRIVLAGGETATIGTPIAVLLDAGDTATDIDTLLGTEPAVQTPRAEEAALETVADREPAAAPASAPPASAPVAAPAPTAPARPAPPPSVTVQASHGYRIFASPIARKIASDNNIDLASVTGTGPDGRITRRDIAAALAQSIATPAASVPVASSVAASASDSGSVPVAAAVARVSAGVSLVPHTGMRKAIARRLTESKATVPHFYLVAECQMDKLLALRADINAAAPQKVSVNDFLIKAVAAAFETVPEANVTWTDEGMLHYDSVDISVAVATDGGLVTPVVRDVAARSVTNISSTVADLAERARNKRLRQDELEGGSFSVSNLGMFGTVEFSAILNPPQWGILAVGTAKKQPVVVDDELAIATVMRCTLSVDHRAVDGALAAQWLAAFQQRIENPISIVA